MDRAHFGDLEQSLPLRRAQIARDGYLALDAVEARGLAAYHGRPLILAALIEAGVTAVIQPGGSKADDKVVAAADAAGIVMAMTGMRHFNH